MVHLSHLQLVVKVGDSTQTLDDGGNLAVAAKVDQQTVEGINLHVAQRRNDLRQHLNALVNGEQ